MKRGKSLTPEQVQLRLEIRDLVNRVWDESGVSMATLGEAIGCTRMTVWKLLKSDVYTRTITMSHVLAWLRHPGSQEFARILLGEMLAQFDVQQLRLIDLRRYADNPRKSEMAVNVVTTLAERFGLIPANQTSTAEVVAK